MSAGGDTVGWLQLGDSTPLRQGGSMNSSEDRLLVKATNGDRQALEELLERHVPAIHRSLSGKIDSRWRASISIDDIMQETAADAVRSIGGFQPQGENAFRRWLFRLAQNNLLDAIKSLQREKRGGHLNRVETAHRNDDTSYCNLIEELGFTTNTPSGEVSLKDARAELVRALEQLPESYRLVVSLYDLAGCSAADAAQACECSEGAMYMRRNRAHAMLKELLGSSTILTIR